MPKKKHKKKKPSATGPGTVPKRKKGESMVAYHDRLAVLIAEATKAGDQELSDRLQRKAGKLAKESSQVARRPRKDEAPKKGPGSYPWYQCVDEQTKRAKGQPHFLPPAEARERANKICGRIRATSRQLYPTYWDIREARANPEADGIPYAGIAVDGGPRLGERRDLIVVVDRSGSLLDLYPILGKHSLSELDSKYPGLPVFGPFQVLASNVRDLERIAERGTPQVEIK